MGLVRLSTNLFDGLDDMDTQFEKAETHQKAEIDNKDYDVESYKFSDEDCEQCDEENMIDSPKDSRK